MRDLGALGAPVEVQLVDDQRELRGSGSCREPVARWPKIGCLEPHASASR